MAIRHFPIREADRKVFEALRDGTKKVETRAAGMRYRGVQVGDEAIFDCGHKRLTKTIVAVHLFPDVSSLLKKYRVQEIVPWLTTAEELTELYYSFPEYRERIAKHGIIAMELA